MVDEPQFLETQDLRGRRGIDVETGEGKLPRLLPPGDVGLDRRCPHEVSLVWRARPLIWRRRVVVRTPDFVLGAVATLWKVLIAANVPAFAMMTLEPPTGPKNVAGEERRSPSLTALARLCVARVGECQRSMAWSCTGQQGTTGLPPAWGTAPWTTHCGSFLDDGCTTDLGGRMVSAWADVVLGSHVDR